MRERIGDIWSAIGVANAICIPTNGIVEKEGSLIMGAGLAKDAAIRFPGIPKTLGQKVERGGNKPYICGVKIGTWLVSFPTKEHYKDPSNIFLIRSSAKELVRLAKTHNWEYIALPKVGCGLGGLKWEDVKIALQSIFDDRFVIWNN